MSIYERGAKWMHVVSAANGTRCIPGDGAGSRLNEVANTTVAAYTANVTDQKAQCVLSSTASVAPGQLAITSDGFFGTVVSVNGGTSVLTVDRWLNARAEGPANRGPAAAATIRFFPAGSCLARAQKVRILRMIVTKSITATALTSIVDHRMASATPVLPWNSVVGNVGAVDLDIQLGGPFGVLTDAAASANVDCTILFTLN
jgi:hypothetical protein